jgi:hypothetical protein
LPTAGRGVDGAGRKTAGDAAASTAGLGVDGAGRRTAGDAAAGLANADVTAVPALTGKSGADAGARTGTASAATA